ncbi:MAG: zinc dependent phospholipase C family protein [Firmicutes bacterium]|nr:zinc dependent phospholipase C family protein [Bacillota bacterium]
MPLPMVHLAVAVKLYEQKNRQIDPEFLLGSLAPDAIHARPGTTRADKDRTHFFFTGDPAVFENQIDTFVAKQVVACDNPVERAFAAGYATHVLTDRVWAMTVFTRFRRAADAVMDKEARRLLYYRETEKVDFQLYRNEPWRVPVWEGLQIAEPLAVANLLTAEEVRAWQMHTLRWFEQNSEPVEEPQYITEAIVNDFIGRATHAVIEQWRLWGLAN